MGYDCFIRIATESEIDDKTIRKIGIIYRKKLTDGYYGFTENCFGVKLHGSGHLENSIDIFKKITKIDPTITFIFYHMQFDYELLTITKIKNKNIITNVEFSATGNEELKNYGINISECVLFDKNMIINNDITNVFGFDLTDESSNELNDSESNKSEANESDSDEDIRTEKDTDYHFTSPIAFIKDPNFIEEMDYWYKSTNFKRDWSTKIPTYLSYFIYWCKITKLQVEINSTIFAGHYYNASDTFEKYLRQYKKLNFKYGYPLTVTNKDNRVMIYQQFNDEMLYFELNKIHELDNIQDPLQFIDCFRKKLCFTINDHGFEITYDSSDSFFKDCIEREINQLFMPETDCL